MAVKAKRFRIGVEGATTDGRNIERAWLEQMAASYDPQVYTALINLEHIKGYTPDSPFRRFGTVDKLEAEGDCRRPAERENGPVCVDHPVRGPGGVHP